LYESFNEIKLFRKHLMPIDTNNLKFFLADIGKAATYDLVIQYKKENKDKYLWLSFARRKNCPGKMVSVAKLIALFTA
jgi:hypothetical protein